MGNNIGNGLNNNHLRVLIVDPEEKFRAQLSSWIKRNHQEVFTTSKLSDWLKNKSLKDYILVLTVSRLDSRKIEQLRQLKMSFPRLAIILLTATINENQHLYLLEGEIVDFICPRNNFLAIYSAVRAELNRCYLKKENENYLKNLTKLKLEHSRNIRKLLKLEEIYDTTVENLMTALDLRDVETFGHSRTVSKYSQVLAELLGIRNQNTLDNIRKGALLHDIGKIAIPDSILKKPGALSPEEWEKIKLHPTLGFGLIKEMKLLKEVGNIILYHHEKYDGSGYPKGLKKDEIPIEARIFALADALDAITSHRPYRPEKDFAAAREEIIKHSGQQFDPEVVEVFCSLELEHWEKIRYESTKLLPSFEDYQKMLKHRENMSN
ncbi:MAG: HD domain-containing protein [Candidatus Aminicenantes bacterium]|nr:HD domain-containing protein [Candidatus Aminicenantes bacterium]